MFEMEKFQGVKPAMFAPHLDTRTIKKWSVKSSDQFNSTYNAKKDQLDAATAKGTDASKQNTNALKNEFDSQIRASRHMNKLIQGVKNVPRHYLSQVEQTGSRYNFEKHGLYYPDLLEEQFKKHKKYADKIANEILHRDYFKLLDLMPGVNTTFAHNISFYSKGLNYIREQDQDNYELLKNDDAYSAMFDQMLNPKEVLNKLDPNFSASFHKTMENIIDNDLSDLNLLNQESPFTDNSQIKTVDYFANIFNVITSQKNGEFVWENFSEKEIFSFMFFADETQSLFEDGMREMIGDAKFFGNGEDPFKDTDVSALAVTEKWWDTFGKHLDEGQLLTYGAVTSMAPLMSAMMDWGDWGLEDNTDKNRKLGKEEFGFREKMITGYMDHLQDEYIYKHFKTNSALTVDKISYLVNSQEKAEEVWADLLQNGYINKAGQVLPAFNPKTTDQDLNINLESGLRGQVVNLLRETAIGDFSLEVQDKTIINSQNKRNITLVCEDGIERTLPEVLDLLNAGDTPLDKINNAYTAYQTFMDIFKSLTQITSDEATSNGQLITKQVGMQYEVTAHSNGYWMERDYVTPEPALAANTESAIAIPEPKPYLDWVKKTGDVKIRFNSLDEATEFKDKIQMVVGLLQPIVSKFSPKNKKTGEPLEILIDNAGSLESLDMITKDSENYSVRTDQLYNVNFFQSSTWQNASNFIGQKAAMAVGEKQFEKSQINRLSRMSHKRKKEKYQSDKEEHKRKELEKVKKQWAAFMKSVSKRRADMMKKIKESRKRMKEARVRAQNNAMKERARRKKTENKQKSRANRNKKK